MKRSPIFLLAAAAYLLLLYGYLLLFYRSPLPSLSSSPGQEWTRLALLFRLVFDATRRPGDLLERWFGAPGQFAVFDRLPVLLAAGVILGCAAALGWVLMALCRADRGLSRLEICVFSTAVGLNAVSTYVLAVGLLGWLGNPLVFALPAALTLAAAGRLRWRRVLATPAKDRRGKRRGPAAAGQQEDDGLLSPRWLWLATPFVLMIVFGGMLPPVDFDVREYHLQVPKEFFQQGRITFLPHNVYGNMAMGSEMHGLLAMVIADDWWLGALAGKTVIAAMAPLTALGLFAAGRRFFSTAAGVVAAVIYISVPWIVSVSTAGLVEGASACYLFLAVYAVLLDGRAREESTSAHTLAHSPARKGGVPSRDRCGSQPRPPGRGYGRLLLAGYLAGSAVSCKYPAVLFVVLPLAVWLFILQARPGKAREPNLGLRFGRPVGVFLLAAFVGCGLWFGKSLVLTGNPTYPLLYDLFGGRTRTPEKNRQWTEAHLPGDFSPAALGRDLARVGLRSEWLSPLLLPLAALALLDRKRRRLVVGLSAYFAYLIGVWWLFTHRIDRFWIPGLPLVALLGGAGACWSRQRWWRWTLIAVLAIGLPANLLVADSIGYGRYCVGLDHLRRDPYRVDSWHRYLNAHAGWGRVLMVGEAQVFDLEMPVLYNTCFDDCLFEQLVRDRSAEEIRRSLAARRISHVYVDWDEIRRYRSRGNYGFTDFVQPSVFEDLVRRGILQPMVEINGRPRTVYRVLPD